MQHLLQDSVQPPPVSPSHFGLQQRSQRSFPGSEEQQQPQLARQGTHEQPNLPGNADGAQHPRGSRPARGLKRSFSMSLMGLLFSYMFVFLIIDTDRPSHPDQGKLLQASNAVSVVDTLSLCSRHRVCVVDTEFLL